MVSAIRGEDFGLQPRYRLGEAMIAEPLDYAAPRKGAIEARPVKGLVAITMATIGAGIFFLRVIKSLLPNG